MSRLVNMLLAEKGQGVFNRAASCWALSMDTKYHPCCKVRDAALNFPEIYEAYKAALLCMCSHMAGLFKARV